MTTVGERLVEGLAARGVEVVFGIPGVHTIELYRGLASGLVRHVTPRHEQGAGFMADGYARVTGKPGVAFVITRPGLTNTLTAMAQARSDSVPMLVISGVNHRESLGHGLGLLHELPDQAAMVRPLCQTERLDDPAQLGAALDRAFAAMLGARPGPAHIEIPTDVMGLPCPPLDTPAPLPKPPMAAPQALAEAAACFNNAQRPVILIGGGARFAEAETKSLAEALDAPVIQTVNARGLLHGHPLAVPASPSLAATRALIRGADAILALGTELGPTDYDMYTNGQLPDLSGMIRVDNQTVDSFYRWWVVHLWVEGVWELIMGGILCFLLIKLTGVDREVVEKWLYIIVGLTFLSGILGTGHHYYYIGTPRYWLVVGGIFSALEPLAFLGMAVYALAMAKKGGRRHPNRIALTWSLGCAIMSFVGAGFLGMAHTLPQVNMYTHGTLITAMHGHLAFWGAYAMIVLAMIAYAMPLLTGRRLWDTALASWAFWTSNIGMVGMTGALAVAGITQVNLERRMGMDFLAVQKEIEMHFIGMLLAASLFTVGIGCFIVVFFRHGRPTDEALGSDPAEDPAYAVS